MRGFLTASLCSLMDDVPKLPEIADSQESTDEPSASLWTKVLLELRDWIVKGIPGKTSMRAVLLYVRQPSATTQLRRGLLLCRSEQIMFQRLEQARCVWRISQLGLGPLRPRARVGCEHIRTKMCETAGGEHAVHLHQR